MTKKPPLHPSFAATVARPSPPPPPPQPAITRVPVTVHIRTADGEQRIVLCAQQGVPATSSTNTGAAPPPGWVLTTSISATVFHPHPRTSINTFDAMEPLIATLAERCSSAIAMNMVVEYHY